MTTLKSEWIFNYLTEKQFCKLKRFLLYYLILIHFYVSNFAILEKDLRRNWTRLKCYWGLSSEALKMGEILIRF